MPGAGQRRRERLVGASYKVLKLLLLIIEFSPVIFQNLRLSAPLESKRLARPSHSADREAAAWREGASLLSHTMSWRVRLEPCLLRPGVHLQHPCQILGAHFVSGAALALHVVTYAGSYVVTTQVPIF